MSQKGTSCGLWERRPKIAPAKLSVTVVAFCASPPIPGGVSQNSLGHRPAPPASALLCGCFEGTFRLPGPFPKLAVSMAFWRPGPAANRHCTFTQELQIINRRRSLRETKAATSQLPLGPWKRKVYSKFRSSSKLAETRISCLCARRASFGGR